MLIPSELARRYELSNKVLAGLDTMIESKQEDLHAITPKCCVYITGSLARREIDEFSDLDLFIVDKFDEDPKSALTFVEQAHLIATLDDVRESAIFKQRKFSRGGGFLHPIPFADMVRELGDPQDDGKNLFTARMLLLINSRPLVNSDAFSLLQEQAIDAYWRGTSSAGELTKHDPTKPYKPIMFMNDLRRWWLTVALNFERQNNHKIIADRVEVNNKNGIEEITLNPINDRRLANLKLRYSRMLGVFSVFAAILALESNGGITRSDFERIVMEPPIERLRLVTESHPEHEAKVQKIVDNYDSFLSFAKGSKLEVAQRVAQNSLYYKRKSASYEFHSDMAELIRTIGADSPLLDYILV